MTKSQCSIKCKIRELQQKMACSNLSSPFPAYKCRNLSKKHFLSYTSRYIPLPSSGLFSSPARIISSASAAMERAETTEAAAMKLLFVEMGVGYDQHGQDITVAAMRACKDAISSNSIPAFRRGSIPGVCSEQMKLQIKLGVPRPTQQYLDIERVKSVFPYGQIVSVEVVDGGLICSSGVCLEAMGDKNDDCYVVNAAIYVGY